MNYSKTFLIVGLLAFVPAATSASTIKLNLTASALVYSKLNDTIYAAVADDGPSNPNTLIPINPHTGKAGTPISIGNNPNQLAVSDDGRYIWAVVERGIDNGVSTNTAIQRYDVSTGQLDVKILSSSGGSQFIERINTIPGRPDSIIVATQPRVGNQLGPTFMATNTVVLPNKIGDSAAAPQSIGVDEAGAFAYGYNRLGDARWAMQISDTGLTAVNQTLPPFASPVGAEDIQIGNGNLYDSKGFAYHLSTANQFATFPVANPSGHKNTFLVDSENNRLFALMQFAATTGVFAYDLDTLSPLDNVSVTSITGSVGNLTRFGGDGLAFTSSNQVVLVRESFVPEPSSLALAGFAIISLITCAYRHTCARQSRVGRG